MKRKGFVAEGDVTLLLKRYDPGTILSLLYEVSKQAAGQGQVKWEEIVKESNTGIKNAREYQALWRHLAYRKDLDPEGEELPLEDDDSDLEFDVEAFPMVSTETSAEAASYANALMGFSTDIAFANAESTALGLTFIYPVFSSATLDAYRKRHRQPWTAQEDDELAAGVDKHGEGNWGAILKNTTSKGGDRTVTQLAQRWALIKKRRETTRPVAAAAAVAATRQGSGHCEQSLKRPKFSSELCEQNGIPGLSGVPSTTSLPKPGQAIQGKAAVAFQRKLASPPLAAQKASSPNPSSIAPGKPRPAAPSSQKLCVVTNQQVTCVSSVQSSTPTPTSQPKQPSLPRTNSIPGRSLHGPDPMVQAAAVAAGARIAPASAAASFMKSKNVVHIRPPTISPNASKANAKNNNSGSRATPVVHYIRTGAAPPILPSFTTKRPAKAAAAPAGAAATKNSSAPNKATTTAMTTASLKVNTNTTVSRLAVNSSSNSKQDPVNKKRKIIVRENNGTLNSHVSSWYEVVLDDTSGGGETGKSSPAAAAAGAAGGAAVVEVDSDTDEGGGGVAGIGGGLVCTSSNESFSQSAFGGALTPNGASPLSQSSGGQSE